MTTESRELEIRGRFHDFVKAGYAKLEQNTRSTAQKMTAAFKGVASQLVSLKGAVAALGVALVFRAGLRNLKEIADKLDLLGKTSDRLNATAESITAVDYAAGLAGLSIEKVTTAIAQFSRNLELAEQGGKQQKLALDALGLSADDFKGKQIDVIDVLARTADHLKEVDDATEKTATLMTLFGRSGAELGSLLKLGGEGIRGLAKDAEGLGLVMSREQLAVAEEFNDSLTRLQAAFEGVGRALTIEIAGRATPALEEFAKIVSENRGQIVDAFLAIADTIGLATKSAIRSVIGLIQTLEEIPGVDLNARKREIADQIQSLSDGIMRLEAQSDAAGSALQHVFDLSADQAKQAAQRQREEIERLRQERDRLVEELSHTPKLGDYLAQQFDHANEKLDETLKRLHQIGHTSTIGRATISPIVKEPTVDFGDIAKPIDVPVNFVVKDPSEQQKALQEQAQKFLEGIDNAQGRSAGQLLEELQGYVDARVVSERQGAQARVRIAQNEQRKMVEAVLGRRDAELATQSLLTEAFGTELDKQLQDAKKHYADLQAALAESVLQGQQTEEEAAKQAGLLEIRKQKELQRIRESYANPPQARERELQTSLLPEGIEKRVQEAQDAANRQHEILAQAFNDNEIGWQQYSDRVREINQRLNEDLYEIQGDAFAGIRDGIEQTLRSWENLAAFGAQSTQQLLDQGLSGLSNALADFALGAKSAKEAFRQFALETLRLITRLVIEFAILAAVRAAAGIGGAASSAGSAGGKLAPTSIGVSRAGALGGVIGEGEAAQRTPVLGRALVAFEDGGVMVPDTLGRTIHAQYQAYASGGIGGGIARHPTLALFFGEGRFPAEAFVPLPDGRSIPVTLRGGGGGGGAMEIHIHAIDTQSGVDFLVKHRNAILGIQSHGLASRNRSRESVQRAVQG